MKKGFTLVELLAVIVVIGIIATIVGVSVTGILDTAEEKSYEQQVNAIIRAVKEWGVEHTEFLPETGTCYIQISTLVDDGKLEGVPQNPKTGADMTGGVEVNLDTTKNQYVYSYKETIGTPLCTDIGEE